MLQFYSLMLLSILLNACGGQSSPTKAKLSPLDIQCNNSQNVSCTSAYSQRKVYIAIKWRANQICATALLSADYRSLFDAHSESTTSLFSGSLTARFTQFFDRSNVSVTQMAFPTAQICGFIDTNSNLRYDSGEPFLSEIFDPSQNLARLLTAWQ